MNRKALLLAILIEVVVFTTLALSIDHCRPLMLAIRVIHAPAIGWSLFFTNWLTLSPNLSNWLIAVFAFGIQTFIWYALLCRVPKIRRDGSVV